MGKDCFTESELGEGGQEKNSIERYLNTIQEHYIVVFVITTLMRYKYNLIVTNQVVE